MDIQALLRQLPSVDNLLKSGQVQALQRKYPNAFILRAVRSAVDRLRERIKAGIQEEVDGGEIIEEVVAILNEITRPRLRPVVNATGIVIHTNLGRAPLSRKVLENVFAIAEGYSNLEYDLEAGRRGKRYAHIKKIINEITGAEDCLVVNNNAAAVLLCLSALARDREVIVSRGELIEIGGSFRIPDVMQQGGAILREVGTTNKTHLRDYENAINENTAMLLKVHRSNYRISGFTQEVPVRDLVSLGEKYDLPVMYDLGSGCLADLRPLGIHDEPTVQEVVRTGVDLTTFSGDKLLGGPQAGIIVGRTDLIQELQRHPLTRALRVDKFTLAALESVFMCYADPERAKQEVPVLKMLFGSEEALKIRARRLAAALKKAGLPAVITTARDDTRAGGGALPEVTFRTWTVSVQPIHLSVNRLEERLRRADPPVIARIQNDRLIFDVMTIKTAHIRQIVSAVSAAFLDRD